MGPGKPHPADNLFLDLDGLQRQVRCGMGMTGNQALPTIKQGEPRWASKWRWRGRFAPEGRPHVRSSRKWATIGRWGRKRAAGGWQFGLRAHETLPQPGVLPQMLPALMREVFVLQFADKAVQSLHFHSIDIIGKIL